MKTRRRNRALIAGIVIVAAFYFVAIFADFLAPYDYKEQTRTEPSAPVSNIELFLVGSDGWHFLPHVRKRNLVDPRNMIYEEDPTQIYKVRLFAHGYSYNLFGFIPASTHLVGVNPEATADAPRLRLLGTDQLGRDRFSRLLHATRFSLLVSPIGTLLACLIGIFVGAISGYAHRSVDAILMGVADTMISLPALILILAARAAFPIELPPISAAMLLIFIFTLIGWGEMARLTRGLVLSIKEREFILAARSIGLSEMRILWRHILPNVAGPLVIQATLMLPVFLLAEIALSFLGVGLQEPEPSLGNMLSAASDVTQIRNAPWLILSPAAAIFMFVLGIRLLGWQRGNDSKFS